MRCRYCDLERKFINAHIIPEGFFRRLGSGTPGLKILTNEPTTYPKRAPVGVYDQHILCEACEPEFEWLDTYAQKILPEDVSSWRPVRHGAEVIAYEAGQYEYGRLKLFFLSVLWRASVSTQAMFKRVKLGPHERRILDMLKARDAGTSDEYGVLLARFVDPPALTIMDPYATKFDQVNYYHLMFGSFLAYVKIDRRLAAYPLRNLQLAPNRPLAMVARDPRTSKEYQVARNIVNAPNNERVFRWLPRSQE